MFVLQNPNICVYTILFYLFAYVFQKILGKVDPVVR
jgi:hypothetical protein